MGRKLSRRRRRLWQLDPRCFWCGVVTVLEWNVDARPGDPRRRLPENFATVDHLHPKYHPDRRKPNPQQEERTVLSCIQCNNLRDREEYAAMPIEEIWKRTGTYERMMADTTTNPYPRLTLLFGAYHRGQQAALRGKSITENPYVWSEDATSLYHAWLEGWGGVPDTDRGRYLTQRRG